MSDARPAWRQLLGRALLFAGLGPVTWSALVLLEATCSGVRGSVDVGTVRYSAALGLRLSAICMTLLVGLWLLYQLQRDRGRGFRYGFQLVLLLLAAPWAWEQAEFLSSGDGVSGHWWSSSLFVGLFVSALLASIGLLNWHLQLTYLCAAQTPLRSGRWPLPVPVLAAAGLAGTALVFGLVCFALPNYTFFAEGLLVPLWVLGVTTAAAPLQRWRHAPLLGSLLLVGLLGWISSGSGDNDSRFAVMRGSRLAGLSIKLLGLNDPRNVARIDLTSPERFSCSPPGLAPLTVPPPGAPEERRNVILISIDALRKEALDWEVDGKPLMPNLRAFAEHGVRFSDMSTSYTSTAFAFGSAFTGLAASQVLLAPQLPPNIFTLTRERFERRLAVLPSSGFFDLPAVDELFLQGTPAARLKGAKRQTHRFIRRLRQDRRQNHTTIAWLHYFEPHAGYRKHKRLDFGDSARERYMSELAFVDRYLGKVFAALDRGGWFDDSLVVVFSDHGEALGEHGYHGHSVHLNRWITETVLALRAPGVVPGEDARLASITDLAPTVLHWAGAPVPTDLDGRSLFLPADPERAIVGESFPYRGTGLFKHAARRYQRRARIEERIKKFQTRSRKFEPSVSLTTREYRLIMHRETGLTELYDRRRDPAENQDIGPRHPAVQRRLIAQLKRWHVEKSEWLHCRLEALAGAEREQRRGKN